MERVGKTELVAKVAEATGLTKKDVAAVIDAFVEAVINEVRQGNVVTVKGLGTFKPVERAATEKRNPQTGGVVKVPARVVLKFKPSSSVKVLKTLG